MSFRPAPAVNGLNGLRIAGFYDGDNYAKGDTKKRLVGMLSFEHKYINAGFEYLDAKDQTTDAVPEIHGSGYSAWVTPRTAFGLEGLIRYDDLKPNKDVDAHKKRTIVGISYWFPVLKGVASAALLDYEEVKYDDPLAKPKEVRYALHTQFIF